MRRSAALLVLAGLFAGSAALPAQAKKAKPARVQTYYVVGGAERFTCSLSVDPKLADPARGCSDDYDGVTQPVLGPEPTSIPAVDGLPLAVDVSRPIRGKVTVRSTSLVGHVGQLGVGEAQLTARLVGVAGGRDVTIGETTTEAYSVTPLQEDYVVEFTIEPDDASAGLSFEALTLELEITGTSTFHNGFPADGSSTLAVPVAR